MNTYINTKTVNRTLLILFFSFCFNVGLNAQTILVKPTTIDYVGNCIPFGQTDFYGFQGFIYRNIPAFTVSPGTKIRFDLGNLNDVPLRRNIYFSIANVNPAVFTGPSQGVKAVNWVQVVDESQVPLNPFGNTITQDFEVTYTATGSFNFPGGGLIIGFGATPPGAFHDPNCDQVGVNTNGSDPSGYFYGRFFGQTNLYTGVLDVNWSVSNNASALQGFMIESNCTAPAITCPVNITVANATNGCGAYVSFTGANAATATGTAPVAISYSPASGSFFNVGSTTVTATATNACGTSTCQFTVTVTDNQPPTAICKNVSVNLDANGNAAVTPQMVDNGSFDNCGNVTLSVSPSNFDCSNLTSSGFRIFTSSGTFTAPPGVTSARVLVVGGGGGGANGHQAGGGSGYVSSATLAVTPGQVIPITVGLGGTGAISQNGNNNIVGITPGGVSSFGGLLSAAGGAVATIINQNGPAGGSGGGGSCNFGPVGGSGGTNGSSGGSCTYTGGPGQGSFVPLLSIFTNNVFTPGARGAGGQSSHSGGGGGGGILMNGIGPSGANGTQSFSGKGGQGYGGGGGAGGYDGNTGSIRYAGGPGASGLVYVEWNSGQNPVTLIVTDNSMNASSCVATVTVVDNIPPTITCQADITQNATSASGAIVNYNTPVAHDNCSFTIARTAGPASGSTFPIGTTTVTYQVTDGSGLTATCSFTVTVVGVGPEVVCPQNITVNNTPGQCSAIVNFTVTEITAIPASTITYSHNPGSSFPVGTTTVTATATNAVGTSTCSFTVTVNDVEAPVSSTAVNFNIYNGFYAYNGTTSKSILDAQIASQTLLGHQNIDCINTFYDQLLPTNSGHGYYITVPFSEATAADFSFRLGADFGGGGAVFLDGIYLTGKTGDRWWNNNWNSPDVFAAYNIPVSAGNHILEIYGWEACCFGVMSIQLDLNADGIWDCAGSLPTVTGECSATVTAPTALDNCAGLITATTIDPTTYNTPGTYTVHWTFNDGHGNSSTSNQTVIINDVTPPVISCPANITVIATSAAGAIVNYIAPVGTDNCSATTTRIAGPASGSTFPIGTTTVTYQVTDGSGLTAACSFTVTVVGVGPEVVCPQNITVNNTPGQCDAVVYFTATETTAIPASTITYSHNPGSSFPVGTTTVLVTATNAVGSSTCSFTVTVNDNQPPVITCPASVTVNAAPGQCSASVTLGEPQVSDNCNGSGNALSFDGGYVTVPDAPILNPFNEWTLETWVRLTTTGIQQSLIEKYNNPGSHYGYMIRVLSNNKIQGGVVFGCCGGYFVSGSTTILANQWYHVATTVNRVTGTMKIYVNGVLDGQITGMINMPVQPNTASLKLGARGDDAATGLTNGGLLDEVRVWNIERTQAQIAASMNLELSAQPGLIALYHLNQGTAGGNNAGLTNVIDASGNNLNGSLQGFTLNGPTSNWVNGRNAASVTVTNNAPAMYPVGNTTVTWTATDAAGNSSSCDQIVTVVDNQPPVITCPAPVSVNTDPNACSAIVNYPVPTVSDNCSGASGTQSFSYTGTIVNWTVPAGVTKITIQANGAEGGAGAQNPNLSPYPAGKGAQIKGDVNVTPGEVLKILVGSKGTGYQSFFAYGNSGGGGSFVTRSDNTPLIVAGGGGGTAIDGNPGQDALITPNGGNISTALGGINGTGGAGGNNGGGSGCGYPGSGGGGLLSDGGGFIPGGGKAFINGGQGGTDDPFSCTTQNPGGFGGGGTGGNGGGGGGGYSGGAGGDNDGTANGGYPPRNFPGGGGGGSFNSGTNQVNTVGNTGDGSVTISWANAPVMIQTQGLPSGSAFPVGTTTNTFVATDASGNSSTCSFTVTVTDNEDPVIICPANITHSADEGLCSYSFTPAPATATDNCGTVTVTGVRSDAKGLSAPYPVGITTITWTATDSHNHSVTCVQTVTITDDENPVIHVQNIFKCFEENNNGCSINLNGTATDNCAIISLTNNAPACFPVGTTVVTWTATDNHAHTVTANQTVTRNPEINITVCAGPTRTIYAGTVNGFGPFGPQCVNLNASANGGTPGYTYSWSPAAGLNNTGISNPVACPTVTTTYTVTVTDSKGCTRTQSITINVLPLSGIVCSGSGNSVKFSVCHVPPGNTGNPQNVCISANSINAHLTTGSVGHNNCYLGPCITQQLCFSTNEITPLIAANNPSAKGIVSDEPEKTDDRFKVNVYPNPSNSEFRIVVNSPTADPITVRIMDMNGAVRTNQQMNVKSNTLTTGSNLNAGTYLAEVIQGKNRAVVKLIKL